MSGVYACVSVPETIPDRINYQCINSIYSFTHEIIIGTLNQKIVENNSLFTEAQ